MNIASEISGIGHNQPPTPFDEVSTEINDLYDEAKIWLDGEPIATQEQADALNTLANRIKDAAKRAEALRKEEVAPLDQAKAEIQSRFNVLIGETKTVTGKTVMALKAVKDALAPYLIELDRQQRAKAHAERAEAEAKRQAAIEAMKSRQTLEDMERAEALVQEARDADKQALKTDKAKPQAKGEGRAIGLRTVKVATLIDPKAAARWIWTYRNAELVAFMQIEAEKAMRAGVVNIDGYEITEERVL